MLHMYACSAAIQRSITSFFPQTGPDSLLTLPFNRAIVGRGVNPSRPPSFIIMWSYFGKCNPLKFVPNHFVLLMETRHEYQTMDIDVCNSPEISDKLSDSESVLSFSPTRMSTPVPLLANEEEVLHTSSLSDSLSEYVQKSEKQMYAQVSEPSSQYKDDLHKVTEKQSQGNAALAGLSICRYLSNERIYSLLKTHSTAIVLEEVPKGPKCNVAFLVDNRANILRRRQNPPGASEFCDDCGAWDKCSGQTQPTMFIVRDNGKSFLTIKYKDNNYVDQKKVNKKISWIPLTQQPSPHHVIIMRRNYMKSKNI